MKLKKNFNFTLYANYVFFTEINANLILTQFLILFEFRTFLLQRPQVFMDNMKFSNLKFCKVLITNHRGKDYYLHYQNLIKCIKNILLMHDITQDFALSYEIYEVNDI